MMAAERDTSTKATQNDSTIGICFIVAHGDKNLLYSRKVLVTETFTACLPDALYQRSHAGAL